MVELTKTDLDVGAGEVRFGLSADVAGGRGANGQFAEFRGRAGTKTFDDNFACDSFER